MSYSDNKILIEDIIISYSFCVYLKIIGDSKSFENEYKQLHFLYNKISLEYSKKPSAIYEQLKRFDKYKSNLKLDKLINCHFIDRNVRIYTNQYKNTLETVLTKIDEIKSTVYQYPVINTMIEEINNVVLKYQYKLLDELFE